MVNTPVIRVVSLSYSLKYNNDVIYDDPPPLTFETPEASFHLDNAILSCHMKADHSAVSEARAAIEPVLSAWELDFSLRQGDRGLRFEFIDAKIIDRTPNSPGTVHGHCYATLSGLSVVASAGTMTPHVTYRAYPEPPRHFKITPEVETLWNRYQRFRDGRESLLSMAYFCLTVVEALAGSRRKAAAKYKVDGLVLSKLGELTSARGDHRTARKIKSFGVQPLSGNEEAWIQETVKQLIWRLGDLRSVADLPMITMADLPPI